MSNTTAKQVIPLSEPELTGNEWQYVKECLDTGWVSSIGSYVVEFEKRIKEYIGTDHAVSVINGTAALHLALLGCKVMPDDEVIVPTLTFVAPANSVRYCGAYPIFMDCTMDTLCLDVQKVTDFIHSECKRHDDGYTYNKKTGRRIKALIAVHIFGHPVDMEPLRTLCEENNIDCIEDAAESCGSEYNGRKTGALSTVGCLSFNGNKIITTGGGGMVVTDDASIAMRIRHLSTQAKKDTFEYDHDAIGYNYRLSNLHAALGVAQMEKLDEFIERKRNNACVYKEALSLISQIELLWEKPFAKSNFWFYTIRVPKKHKNLLIKHLVSRNIHVRPIWKLIHTLPMYQGFQVYAINTAHRAYESCINLPCSVFLQKEEIVIVVDEIKKYFKKH